MVNKAMVEKLAEQVFTVLQEDIIMVILVRRWRCRRCRCAHLTSNDGGAGLEVNIIGGTGNFYAGGGGGGNRDGSRTGSGGSGGGGNASSSYSANNAQPGTDGLGGGGGGASYNNASSWRTAQLVDLES